MARRRLERIENDGRDIEPLRVQIRELGGDLEPGRFDFNPDTPRGWTVDYPAATNRANAIEDLVRRWVAGRMG